MNKIIFGILLVAAFASTGSNAQAQQTGESCGEIDLDAPRLRCYDSLFRPSTTIATPAQSTGKWQVTTEVSPIDDSAKVYLRLVGDNGIKDRFGREEQMTLTIACRENTTSLWVYFGGNFMSDNQGRGRVTYRIDSHTAQTKSFGESNNNMALGLWTGGASIPFVKSLFDGERLYLQATPFSDSVVSDFFSIGGLEKAIKPLREACNW